MQYRIITDEHELNRFCEHALKQGAVAVDTEFVRTRTLTPQLGLIQLYDGQHLVLVDPLAIKDFSLLKTLLTSPDVVKVLHSCSEDLEAFWHALQIQVSPVFDTQFAGTLLNMGNALGYAKLIQNQLDIHLDKGESRTNWLARPLSEKQLHYAANDVYYLWQVYPALYQQCQEQAKLAWIFDDMQRLADKKSYVLPSEAAYFTIKNNWQLNQSQLLILKQLAAWRLDYARKKDISVNFIVKENALLDIAKYAPQNRQQLNKIADLDPRDIRKHGQVILDMVNSCQQQLPEVLPNKLTRLVEFPNYKQVCQKLRELCMQVAKQHDIPVEVLASKKQINQLLMYRWLGERYTGEYHMLPDLAVSWRNELLSSSIEQVLN